MPRSKFAPSPRLVRHLALVGLALVGAGCSSRTSHPHPLDLSRLLAAKPPKDGPHFQPLPDAERATRIPTEPEEYRIGVGDVLNVQGEQFRGFGETTRGEIAGTKVKPDGRLYLPGLPPVEAKGRTVLEVQAAIAEALSMKVKDPYVSVDVLDYRSQKYFVLGEVGQPGVLPVDGEASLLEAVARAGGFAKDADLEQAFVVRNQQVLPVSLADVVRRGDLKQNLTLRHRDLIVVPSQKVKRVFVLGEVATPGVFPFVGTDGDREMTLVEAIALAGDLKPESADVNQLRVFRGGWCNPEVFTISACELHTHGAHIQLFPGDRVVVAPMKDATYARTLALAMPFLTAGLSLGTVALAVDGTR